MRGNTGERNERKYGKGKYERVGEEKYDRERCEGKYGVVESEEKYGREV